MRILRLRRERQRVRAKSKVKCDLHAGRLPREALDETLICVRCGGKIPASARP
jgi:hypothetical protein